MLIEMKAIPRQSLNNNDDDDDKTAATLSLAFAVTISQMIVFPCTSHNWRPFQLLFTLLVIVFFRPSKPVVERLISSPF